MTGGPEAPTGTMVLASGVKDYGPEDEDDEKQPFYLGKRNNDRRFSMSKEAREHNARQRMLRHVVPTYFTKPFVTVEVDDEDYVSSVREIAVNIPARMHLVVENHKLVNPRVEWRDFDVHFLSGVSRPRFTLRQDPNKKGRFVVEILANLAGHGVFSVSCKGVPVLGSPFQIQAINPSWNSQHSYAEVPAKTHCGDIVRVNIICRDQFGHIFTEAQENVEVAIAGPAVVNKILLQDRSPGVKELVFKATKVGMYTIDITAFGESFRGGPYRVDVMPAAPSPKRTKLSGEGIVKAVAGCVHNFIMEPRDVYDNARKLNTEGEVWHAELVDSDTKTTFPITMEIERKNRKQDIFKCSYRAFKSGIYRISLRVEHSHGKSSHALLPELITVLPGLTSGRKSELRVKASSGYWTQKDDGKRMWCIKAGTSLTINVQACDKYGNKKMRETSELLCRMSYMEQEDADRKPDINIQVINNKNGSYVATLNGTVSGTYMCSVELRGENVGYAPFLLRIEPSTLDIPSCVATGRMNDVIKDGIVGLVGEPNMLLVQAKDCFGNTLERGGHQFVAVLRYQEGQPNESGITHLDPLTFLSKDKDDGTYVFEYKTNISGTYELSIESFSQNVMHSPFPLSMKGQRDIASVLISSTSSLRAVAGNKSTFTVVALDTFQNRQVTGGMMIIPEISLRQDDATRRSPQQAVVKDALIPTQVIDNDDGTYQILYTTDIVGTYEVVIKYMDPSKKYSKPQVVEIIDTGNKELTIVPADVDPESCMIQEAENLNVEAGSEGVFTVVTLDKYGNVVTRGGARVEAHGYKEFLPEGTADIYLECLVTDNDDGTYSVQFKGYQAGTYICEVTINDVNVKGLEYKVGIVPGLTDPQSCEITGDGLKVGQCGEVAQFTIVSKDKYGNYPDHTNEKFLVYLQPLGFKTKSCTMSEGTTRLRAKTMYKGEGKYTVEYVPRRSCLYEVSHRSAQPTHARLLACAIEFPALKASPRDSLTSRAVHSWF